MFAQPEDILGAATIWHRPALERGKDRSTSIKEREGDPLTIHQGERQSTAVAYLHSVQRRPNLAVWTQTLATRVLFEGTRAVGVAYLQDGLEQHMRVKKEVISLAPSDAADTLFCRLEVVRFGGNSDCI